MSQRKIKVIHIITKLELGGAQQTTLYTLAHLDRTRYIPVLICGPGGLLLSEALDIPGLKIHICRYLIRPIAPIHDLLALIVLWKILRKERINHNKAIIVHTHSSKAGILGRWAAFFARLPIRIHSVHGFGITPYQSLWFRGMLTLAERLTGFVTTRMIYVSRDNLQQGLNSGISNPKNSLIIRSGIEWSKFVKVKDDRNAVKKTLNIPDGSKVVGMISCFKPQKSPLDFIRMADQVSQVLPETHFILIGDGRLRPDIEGMVKRLGLHHNVHLTGWRRDIPGLIGIMDIMTLTSLWEGLPKVVVEAQLMGVPVVATNISGVNEVVKEGISGFILPPGRPDMMASKVVELLKNPELIKRMGNKARLISKEFDLDESTLKQEDLYQGLINNLKFRNNNLMRWGSRIFRSSAL